LKVISARRHGAGSLGNPATSGDAELDDKGWGTKDTIQIK